jgi:hypothetical protein
VLKAFVISLALAGLLLAGCGHKSTPASTPTPTATPAMVPLPGPDPTPPPGARLAGFFPMGPGRDLVLEYCGTCHSLATVVTARKTPAQWGDYMKNRRADLPFLADVDIQTIQDYLVANFTPDQPVPQRPPDVLQ